MGVYERIKDFSDAANTATASRTNKIISLYSLGVKAKLRHAEFAYERIRDLTFRIESSPDSTLPETFSTQEQTHFYVDAFFAFLYSAFDVVSHVVNAEYKLGLNERKTSFDSINRELSNKWSGTAIQLLYSKISRKQYFRALDKYRNCSTHRRQIFIQTIRTTVTSTPGYDASTTMQGTQNFLCDNPLSRKPKITQKRELIFYCGEMLRRVMDEIENIYSEL
jgi:hypothetical protein